MSPLVEGAAATTTVLREAVGHSGIFRVNNAQQQLWKCAEIYIWKNTPHLLAVACLLCGDADDIAAANDDVKNLWPLTEFAAHMQKLHNNNWHSRGDDDDAGNEGAASAQTKVQAKAKSIKKRVSRASAEEKRVKETAKEETKVVKVEQTAKEECVECKNEKTIKLEKVVKPEQAAVKAQLAEEDGAVKVDEAVVKKERDNDNDDEEEVGATEQVATLIAMVEGVRQQVPVNMRATTTNTADTQPHQQQQQNTFAVADDTRLSSVDAVSKSNQLLLPLQNHNDEDVKAGQEPEPQQSACLPAFEEVLIVQRTPVDQQQPKSPLKPLRYKSAWYAATVAKELEPLLREKREAKAARWRTAQHVENGETAKIAANLEQPCATKETKKRVLGKSALQHVSPEKRLKNAYFMKDLGEKTLQKSLPIEVQEEQLSIEETQRHTKRSTFGKLETPKKRLKNEEFMTKMRTKDLQKTAALEETEEQALELLINEETQEQTGRRSFACIETSKKHLKNDETEHKDLQETAETEEQSVEQLINGEMQEPSSLPIKETKRSVFDKQELLKKLQYKDFSETEETKQSIIKETEAQHYLEKESKKRVFEKSTSKKESPSKKLKNQTFKEEFEIEALQKAALIKETKEQALEQSIIDETKNQYCSDNEINKGALKKTALKKVTTKNEFENQCIMQELETKTCTLKAETADQTLEYRLNKKGKREKKKTTNAIKANNKRCLRSASKNLKNHCLLEQTEIKNMQKPLTKTEEPNLEKQLKPIRTKRTVEEHCTDKESKKSSLSNAAFIKADSANKTLDNKSLENLSDETEQQPLQKTCVIGKAASLEKLKIKETPEKTAQRYFLRKDTMQNNLKNTGSQVEKEEKLTKKLKTTKIKETTLQQSQLSEETTTEQPPANKLTTHENIFCNTAIIEDTMEEALARLKLQRKAENGLNRTWLKSWLKETAEQALSKSKLMAATEEQPMAAKAWLMKEAAKQALKNLRWQMTEQNVPAKIVESTEQPQEETVLIDNARKQKIEEAKLQNDAEYMRQQTEQAQERQATQLKEELAAKILKNAVILEETVKKLKAQNLTVETKRSTFNNCENAVHNDDDNYNDAIIDSQLLPSVKLSSAQILQLIELYKVQPLLWNAAHEDFSDSALCSAAWLHVKQSFNVLTQKNFTVNDIKIRISTLCQRYKAACERLNDEYHALEPTKFLHFEALRFLDEQPNALQSRRTIFNKQNTQLLEIYQDFPQLWHSVQRYKHTAAQRWQALQEISAALKVHHIHMTGEAIQRRLHALHNCYRKEKMQSLHCALEKREFRTRFKHFAQMKYLNKHIAPFVCSFCGKILERFSDYKQHLRETHANATNIVQKLLQRRTRRERASADELQEKILNENIADDAAVDAAVDANVDADADANVDANIVDAVELMNTTKKLNTGERSSSVLFAADNEPKCYQQALKPQPPIDFENLIDNMLQKDPFLNDAAVNSPAPDDNILTDMKKHNIVDDYAKQKDYFDSMFNNDLSEFLKPKCDSDTKELQTQTTNTIDNNNAAELFVPQPAEHVPHAFNILQSPSYDAQENITYTQSTMDLNTSNDETYSPTLNASTNAMTDLTNTQVYEESLNKTTAATLTTEQNSNIPILQTNAQILQNPINIQEDAAIITSTTSTEQSLSTSPNTMNSTQVALVSTVKSTNDLLNLQPNNTHQSQNDLIHAHNQLHSHNEPHKPHNELIHHSSHELLHSDNKLIHSENVLIHTQHNLINTNNNNALIHSSNNQIHSMQHTNELLQAQNALQHNDNVDINLQNNEINQNHDQINQNSNQINQNNDLINTSNVLIDTQNELLHLERDLTLQHEQQQHTQHSLIHSENVATNSLNNLIHTQNDLLFAQNDMNNLQNGLLQQQNGLIHGQHDLNHPENELIHSPNDLIYTDNNLIHSQNALNNSQIEIISCNEPLHTQSAIISPENARIHSENARIHSENAIIHSPNNIIHSPHTANNVISSPNNLIQSQHDLHSDVHAQNVLIHSENTIIHSPNNIIHSPHTTNNVISSPNNLIQSQHDLQSDVHAQNVLIHSENAVEMHTTQQNLIHLENNNNLMHATHTTIDSPSDLGLTQNSLNLIYDSMSSQYYLNVPEQSLNELQHTYMILPQNTELTTNREDAYQVPAYNELDQMLSTQQLSMMTTTYNNQLENATNTNELCFISDDAIHTLVAANNADGYANQQVILISNAEIDNAQRIITQNAMNDCENNNFSKELQEITAELGIHIESNIIECPQQACQVATTNTGPLKISSNLNNNDNDLLDAEMLQLCNSKLDDNCNKVAAAAQVQQQEDNNSLKPIEDEQFDSDGTQNLMLEDDEKYYNISISVDKMLLANANCTRLTEAQTYQLISMYKDQELLWNPHHKDYETRELRRIAWKSITTTINKLYGLRFQTTTIYKKVSDHIKYYRKEKERVTKTNGTSKWYYYYHFNFLDDVLFITSETHKILQEKEINMKIISIYKSYPQLWDTLSAEYKKRLQRNRYVDAMHLSLQEEANIQIPLDKLKRKLLDFRGNYRHEKEKRIDCTNNNEPFESFYDYYNELSFLEPHIPPFICSECNESFAKLTEIMKHYRLTKHVKLNKRRASKTLPNGEIELKNVCHICGAKFTMRNNLLFHMNRHLGKRTHQCTICPMNFYNSTALRVHVRSHTKEKPYMCEECGQSFVNKSKLNQHLKRHKNQRDHECETCGKKFFTAFERDKHAKRHLQIRDQICPVCGKAFVVGSSIYTHMQLHTGVKKHACKLCDKRFAQGSGLYRHMRKHREGQIMD